MTQGITAVAVAALEHFAATIRRTGAVPDGAPTLGTRPAAEIADIADTAAATISDYEDQVALRALAGRSPDTPIVHVNRPALQRHIATVNAERAENNEGSFAITDLAETLSDAASSFLWEIINEGGIITVSHGLDLHVYPLGMDDDPTILICLSRVDGIKVTGPVSEIRDLHPDPWSTDPSLIEAFVNNTVAVANRLSFPGREIAAL